MELAISSIRVMDFSENKIMEFTGKPTEVNDYLQNKEDILRSYQRVKIDGATEGQKKQNWTNCYSWNVHFQENSKAPAVPVQQYQMGNHIPQGYISEGHAQLLAQVQMMSLNLEYFKKEMEFKQQLTDATNSDPMRYAPLAGMFLDIDDKKMGNMMKMFQIQSAMNGKAALAGPPTAPVSRLSFAGVTEPAATVAPAEDEVKNVEALQQHMITIRDAIGWQKLLSLTGYLKNNPGMADTLLTMIPKP